VDYRIRERTPTRRVVASCCNSAHVPEIRGLDFGFRRTEPALRVIYPPLEMRTQTRFRRANTDLPHECRITGDFGMRLFAKLVTARVSMFSDGELFTVPCLRRRGNALSSSQTPPLSRAAAF